MATLEQARAAKQALREALARADGISGVGLSPADPADGAGEPATGAVAPTDTPVTDDAGDWCVVVNVTTAEVSVQVPSDVDGVPVRVRVTGTIRAF